MSESVASALQILNNKGTRETRVFIRMIDTFFDYLNVKSPKLGQLKRKDSILPYRLCSDERFKVFLAIVLDISHYPTVLQQWLKGDFMKYLNDWQQEANAQPVEKREKQKFCLSRETVEGMKITSMYGTMHKPKHTV